MSDPASDPDLIAETQDHWWVQAYLNGAWVDLDPSFSYANAGDMFAGSITAVYDETPDNLRHKVTVKLRVEDYHPLNIGGGSPGFAYSYPLNETLNSVELVGRPLTLQHLVNTNSQGGLIFSYVQHTYEPYLIIGDSEAYLEGESFQELISNFPFGTFMITAEWLTLEIQTPDGAVESFQRTIFDSVGVAARQGGGILPVEMSGDSPPKVTEFDSITVWVGTSRTDPVHVENLGGDFMDSGVLMEDLRLEMAPLLDQTELSAADLEALIPLRTAMRQTLREYNELKLAVYAATDDQITDYDESFLVRTYADRPRLLVAVNTFDISQPDTISASNALDLLSADYRTIAAPGQSVEAEPAFRLVLGISQTNAETVVNERAFGLTGAVSTFTIFTAAEEQGIEIVSIAADNLADLAALQISDQAKARITSDVQNGNTVVVPAQMVPINGIDTIGWWRVNPETGYAIGVLEGGQHGAFFDYVTTWDLPLRYLASFC